jgi:hypothetical protein
MNLKPVIAAFDTLKAEGLITDFVIGGAMSSAFYMAEPLTTADVDIFIALATPPHSLIDLSPIYARLTELGHKPAGEHVDMEASLVQLLVVPSPLEQEAMDRAEFHDYDGASVKVFRPEHLAAVYVKLGRPKDLFRIQHMKDYGVLDFARLEDIIRRHGLEEQWKKTQARLS